MVEGSGNHSRTNRSMNILSLFDHTGTWSQPYRDNGYHVTQIDYQNTGQDVRLLTLNDLPTHIRGIMAAPPCTVFASSGARWPRSNEDMIEGLSCVDAALRLVQVFNPAWWVIENPIGKLARYLGKPRMYFNPCDYAGHLPERERGVHKAHCIMGRLQHQPPARARGADARLKDALAVWRQEHENEERSKRHAARIRPSVLFSKPMKGLIA